ncbi:MAG: enoyl-CoA hydratase/isomerase family protein [Acidimicrobiia bacterium]
MDYTLTESAAEGSAPVAHLRLDDGKANALNAGLVDTLAGATERAGVDAAGALVIWGRPGCFSGGIDLKVLRRDDVGSRLEELSQIARGLLALWTAPIPTVAAVTGHAIAGGAVLAMACDRRIAIDDPASRIGVNETALGMVFPTWALVIARAAIHPDRLTDTMLLGSIYPPGEAASTGMVERAVPAGDFEAAVAAAAAEAAALPTAAYAGTKRQLRGAEAARAEAEIQVEMTSFRGPT